MRTGTKNAVRIFYVIMLQNFRTLLQFGSGSLQRKMQMIIIKSTGKNGPGEAVWRGRAKAAPRAAQNKKK